MSGYDWLLFLHVLSAFALVGAMAAFWGLVAATRPGAPMLSQAAAGRLARPTNVVVIAGTVGTLVFGIWLAIAHDVYQVWDGWVLGSLVLWGLSGYLGDQSGKAFTRAMEGSLEERSRGLRFHTAGSAAIFVILVLMIWKPGA